MGERVKALIGLRDRHAVKHVDAAPLRLCAAQALLMHQQGLHELMADLKIGIEAGHRVLKDHGDAPAPHLIKGLGREG